MQFKQVSPQSEANSGLYIKLKDKESVKGVFRGDPHDFKQHFPKGEKKSFTCTEEPSCEWCTKGDKAKFRFRINVITRDAAGTYNARIFEQGIRVYEAMKNLNDSGYNLERTLVQITRNGDDTSTTYSILPVPNAPINDLMEKTLASVKLNELSNNSKPDVYQQPEPGSDMDMSDIPF